MTDQTPLTPGDAQRRKHFWISNAAFTRMTGAQKVCMDCGQTSINPDPLCPGRRPERQRQDCTCEGEFVWACGPECSCFHHREDSDD